jgi:hypothetical protein
VRLTLPLRRKAAAVTAVATLSALLSIAMPAAEADRPGDGFDRPSGPASVASRRAADRALTRALAFADSDVPPSRDGRGRDASIVLRDLALAQPSLRPVDRRTAERVLARPTNASGDGFLDYADDARVTNDCVVSPVAGSRFCVWWAKRTRDAPPLADSDGDRVPNKVEATRKVLNNTWTRLVTRGGYPAPPADGRGPKGYKNRFDVYLGDLGAQGLYGYCVPESSVTAYRATSYCALDEDFSSQQFRTNTPLGNLQVTGAHEFFHAVQFGIDYTEDGFFLENSSTWVEDELYDNVNDNRNYFPDSSLRRPADPLDKAENWYGNWIWLRFLTETFPARAGSGLPTLIREAWNRSNDTPAAYSVQALAATVEARGGSLAELLADFATANRFPAKSYDEGGSYPVAPAQRSVTVSSNTSGSATVDHLATATVAAFPASGLGAGSQLRVSVNAPSLPDDLQVNVTRFRQNGTIQTSDLALDSSGDGTVTLPFAPADTRRVDVTLANGGTDYACWTRGDFACQGDPLDDNRVFAYDLTVLPPAP